MRGKEGYIALLDVLGFQQLVARESYHEDLDCYTQSIEQVSQTDQEDDLEYLLFSDTIVINTEDVERTSLLKIVRFCSRILGRLLSERIPLRGAIAGGSYVRHRSAKGVFLAGRPVVEAYNFEKEQDWVGIILHPSVLEQVPDLHDRCKIPRLVRPASRESALMALGWARYLQPFAGIPFHAGNANDPNSYEGFAVVPTVSDAHTKDEIIAGFNEVLKGLNRLKSLAPDPQAQKKYTNTLKWLESVKLSWEQTQNLAPAPEDFGQ